MNRTSAVPAALDTLRVPGALLHYEVRGHGPPVVLVGAPMDARPFTALADLLAADYTVLTTDPRGINRSLVDDPGLDSAPELRADDLSRLLARLDAGPAAVLGSSGGAVSALALVQAHPEQVSVVIAHEPPLHELLEDRAELRAQTEDIITAYLSGDVAGAWKKFFVLANFTLPEGALEQMLGGRRSARDAADDHFQHAHMLRPTTQWQPDLAALRSGPRIVVGIGEESGGQLCDRTATALAAALSVEPAMFPGGHVGFAENPAGFAARLREFLPGN